MLAPFVPMLASTDYSVAFEELALPQSFLKAVITHRGALTPDFQYLKEFLTRSIPGVQL
jgi:hypothetical protein